MIVLGIDASIKNTGLFVLPDCWDGGLESIIYKSIVVDASDGLTNMGYEFRLKFISDQVVEFAMDNNVDVIGLEQYAFSRFSRSSRPLAELGGVLRVRLFTDMDICTTMVEASAARKKLMGGYRGKRKTDSARGIKVLSIKKQLEKFLKNRRFFLDGWDDNIIDAFAIAHFLYCKMHKVPSFFEPAHNNELVEVRRGKK